MASNADFRVVVRHILLGDLDQKLCRVCLLPLSEEFESVSTTICKEDHAYSVADVLQKVCQIEVSESDHFNVCKDCFYAAASAFEFYLTVKRSTEILQTYTEELQKRILFASVPENPAENPLCFTLPPVDIKTKLFDFNLDGCLRRDPKLNVNNIAFDEENDCENFTKSFNHAIKSEPADDIDETFCFSEVPEDDSDADTNDDAMVVLVTGDDDSQTNTRQKDRFTNTKVARKHTKKNNAAKVERTRKVVKKPVDKVRKTRSPLAAIQCTKCPVIYRFMARFKEHMKMEHGIHLYVCKICKTTCGSEQEFTTHLRSHSGVQRCYICDEVFLRPEALTAHIQRHDATASLTRSEEAHICEQCGTILPDEKELHEHYQRKHLKKFSCHVCGRQYKYQLSLDKHIEKHEMFENHERPIPIKSSAKSDDSSLTCETCGKQFVDRRALLWHSMLHTNERPFKCDVCGRGFISVNRRNQHALCAHTAPTRRCPLCPALFHLRSMVNTHIKKVHLTVHKRRMRTSKHQNASWRTVTVPIPDLSVELQSHIIELKSKLERIETDEMSVAPK